MTGLVIFMMCDHLADEALISEDDDDERGDQGENKENRSRCCVYFLCSTGQPAFDLNPLFQSNSFF